MAVNSPPQLSNLPIPHPLAQLSFGALSWGGSDASHPSTVDSCCREASAEGGGGAKACNAHYQPTLVSKSPLSDIPVSSLFLLIQFPFKNIYSLFCFYSPSLVLHLNSYRLEFRLLLCGPSFFWVHLREGGEILKLSAWQKNWIRTLTEPQSHCKPGSLWTGTCGELLSAPWCPRRRVQLRKWWRWQWWWWCCWWRAGSQGRAPER